MQEVEAAVKEEEAEVVVRKEVDHDKRGLCQRRLQC